MNIFYLDQDPKLCAQYHCDKHVVKMITEYAQIMCTVHRMLRGTLTDIMLPNKKIKKVWLLPHETADISVKYADGDIGFLNPSYSVKPAFDFYNATHHNHPCTIWARTSTANYKYLYELFVHLLNEYTVRYNKVHACARLMTQLAVVPFIEMVEFTQPALVMPQQYHTNDAVQSYRYFYQMEKSSFAKWKTVTPDWYTKEINVF